MPLTTFLFDLDMTLLDTAMVKEWREKQRWDRVRENMSRVKPFATRGTSPHELPIHLRERGHNIGVVTTSPRWYADFLLKTFDIPYDALVTYGDTQEHKPDPEPITKALDDLGVAPEAACYVGDDPFDVEASYHAGVLSVGAGWGVRDEAALSSAAPTLYFYEPDTLLASLADVARFGYVAETMAAELEPSWHNGAMLPCGGTPPRFVLGRYFPAQDPRHATSQLSSAVLALKDCDDPAEFFGRALATFFGRLKRFIPTRVVPVPPKPSQTRNRFERVLDHATHALPAETEVKLDGLRCVSEIANYKGMNPAERAEAIAGSYTTDHDWMGARVLLLDDVITTGSTIDQCAKVLAERGAEEILAVGFCKDQTPFTQQSCPECGRKMKVRTERATRKKFWGCTGYPNTCQCTVPIE